MLAHSPEPRWRIYAECLASTAIVALKEIGDSKAAGILSFLGYGASRRR